VDSFDINNDLNQTFLYTGHLTSAQYNGNKAYNAQVHDTIVNKTSKERPNNAGKLASNKGIVKIRQSRLTVSLSRQ